MDERANEHGGGGKGDLPLKEEGGREALSIIVSFEEREKEGEGDYYQPTELRTARPTAAKPPLGCGGENGEGRKKSILGSGRGSSTFAWFSRLAGWMAGWLHISTARSPLLLASGGSLFWA